MTQPESKVDDKTNQGFIFGLSLGAAVGALSAILIHKNGQSKIVQNFESKVKDFFEDLIEEIKPQREESKETYKDIETPISVTPKKPTPKMFVKPKK